MSGAVQVEHDQLYKLNFQNFLHNVILHKHEAYFNQGENDHGYTHKLTGLILLVQGRPSNRFETDRHEVFEMEDIYENETFLDDSEYEYILIF